MSIDKKEIEKIFKEANAAFHQLSAEEQKNLSNMLKTQIEKNKSAEQTPPENANETSGKHQDAEFSVLDLFLLPTIFASVLCTLMLLAAYHFLINQKTSIAVVDVAEVVAIQQTKFVNLLSGNNVTDKDREKSFSMVSSFGERMKASIKQIQQECKCTLVVKSAIIGEVADYTDSLKAKMGMAGMTAENTKQPSSEGSPAEKNLLEGLQGLNQ